MSEAHRLWSRLMLGAAGLLGASGVALGAASAHLGGGDFARIAAFFLLVHAGALPGLVAIPVGRMGGRLLAAGLLAVGVALFSGDLAVLGFTGHTPVAGVAPIGGLLMISGWLMVAGVAVTGGPASIEARENT